jgi:hypothetical protein
MILASIDECHFEICVFSAMNMETCTKSQRGFVFMSLKLYNAFILALNVNICYENQMSCSIIFCNFLFTLVEDAISTMYKFCWLKYQLFFPCGVGSRGLLYGVFLASRVLRASLVVPLNPQTLKPF